MQKEDNEFSKNILDSLDSLRTKRKMVYAGFLFIFIIINIIFLNFILSVKGEINSLNNDKFVLDNRIKKLGYLLINKNKIENKNIELKNLISKNNLLFLKNFDTQELLSFISSIAKKANIDIDVFKPLSTKDGKFLIKTSFLLQGTGNYFDILKFLELLENKKTLLKLKEVSINKNHSLERKTKKPSLELNLQFDVFKLKNNF